MNTTRLKHIYLAFLITGFFLIPSVAGASDSISLTDHEKNLIEQGEIIVREVETVGKDGKTFEAIGLISASRGTILQILSEYEKYPEFMPNVSQVEIVGRIDNGSVLNYTLTLPMGKIKKYRLGMTVSEPESRSSLIQWQLQNWPELKPEETIKDTSGFWRMEEISRNSSLVQYRIYTDPGPIPFGLGWIVDALSKNSVPEAFLQTKARSERIALTNASLPEIQNTK